MTLEVEPRQEVVVSSVEFPSEEVTMRGFLARSRACAAQESARGGAAGRQDPKPKPALVIIHEWWGLNDHIKDLAQRFAREGYVALAPDLYSRLPAPAGAQGGPGGNKVTRDPNEAAKLMESLQSQHALKDLNAATRYLKAQPFVDPLKLGAVGFCMGGTFTLMLASHNSDVKAAVPFYGQIPPTDNLKYLLCPILYIYGGQDGWITKQDVDRLQQGFKQFGRPGEVRIYPNCPHAFFNDTRPDVYRSAEAKDAWQQMLRFLAAHLR